MTLVRETVTNHSAKRNVATKQNSINLLLEPIIQSIMFADMVFHGRMIALDIIKNMSCFCFCSLLSTNKLEVPNKILFLKQIPIEERILMILSVESKFINNSSLHW